jgi:non-canonical (house-cleaning) NTP pyrophosphatase
MKIKVGSKNKTKIQAVHDAITLYPNHFSKPEITGIDVEVELFGHPKNIKETMQGQ